MSSPASAPRRSLSDLLAGVTAAAVVLPKAMAYASVAGLPVAVGLYTALVPMLIMGSIQMTIPCLRSGPLPRAP